MNTLTHPVAPEEIMALLDGELTAAEAESVAQHIDQCAECAVLRDDLRATSKTLATWTVPAVSPELDRSFEPRIIAAASARRSVTPNSDTGVSLRNWRVWAFAGGGAIVGAIALLLFSTFISYDGEHVRPKQARVLAYLEPEADKRTDVSEFKAAQAGVAGTAGYAATDSLQASARSRSDAVNEPIQGKLPSLEGVIGGAAPAPPPPPTAGTPMIARTVSLTILVKNIAASRAALDTILTQHHAYAAQLTINTPEAGSRSFQSSLRVPAPDLASALDALRTLGRVQTETQSGEEVTQQHTDLVARLTNARETEIRLRDILAHRTGKMEDVLEVEEKISDTRGEIEQLEADQKALEHRVDFASVDLTLTEEYKAQLGGSSASVGTRMHNSFIEGLRTAGASLVNVILFLEEAGPVLLIWIAILGTPILLLWRRYRRARSLIP